MNELTSATGVPKSTVLYYLGQGLLPQPRKTSPNMAYYEPSSIDRIRLIQQLQKGTCPTMRMWAKRSLTRKWYSKKIDCVLT